jgi:hypothetical protein
MAFKVAFVRTAIKLSEDATYELMLDENFVCHVRKNSVAVDGDMSAAFLADRQNSVEN